MFGTRSIVLTLLLAFSGWQWGGAALIYAKAALAPILIERSWDSMLEQGPGQPPVKPWPWADTWPVARLRVAGREIDLFVLAGANGASLPFGPGHLTGSAEPGDVGTIIVAGHRDTHFEFLHRLAVGELIMLQHSSGRRRFRVADREVVNADLGGLVPDETRNQLVLVTCLQTGFFRIRGPYRLVVTALEV